jgi:hypothetical protein
VREWALPGEREQYFRGGGFATALKARLINVRVLGAGFATAPMGWTSS